MTDQTVPCPACGKDNTYFDGTLFNCSECFHDWVSQPTNPTEETQQGKVCDAFGNALQDGDAVTIIKDLKVKGSSNSVKIGTKVKNIKIIDGADGHNIGCKITGFGSMNLKSEFVKKS